MLTIRKSLFALLVAALVVPVAASSAFADDGTAALAFIPQDTMVVMAIDLDGLRKTSIFKEVMDTALSDPEVKEGLEKLKKAAGFDPMTDLSSLVIAVPPDVEQTENFLFIAKGKVDEAKIIEFAKKEGGEIKQEKHQGITWYHIDNEAGIAFDGGHIILGPAAALKAALDTKKGAGKAIKANAQISKMISAVDKKSNMWIAVSLPDAIRKQMGAENPMAGDIESAHASLHLASGLKLRLTMTAGAEKTATELVNLANEALKQPGAKQQMAGMGLGGAIDSLKVAASGKDINLSLDLSDAELAIIKQLMQGLAGGMR